MDGNGASVRVILFDYKKAFDLIDHAILANKLRALGLLNGIFRCTLNFLKCRKQRVKLGNNCTSEWKSVPADVPQGTKLGPWLFLLMVDDIQVTNNDLWKYVDDMAMVGLVGKDNVSNIQLAESDLEVKSNQIKFKLNESTCKELRISFAKSAPDFVAAIINGNPVELVSSVKLLRLNISKYRKWNLHVDKIIHKVSTCLYFPMQLKQTCKQKTYKQFM